ncbi:MAG: ABC transporter substrate-binding protein [Candidatus Velthaea sp.]
MPSPRSVLRGIALALGAALLSTFSAPAGAAESTYDIDVIISLTGNAAFLGKEQVAALDAVEKIQNARGGIGGRKVHFVIQDDASNPQTAVQLTNGVLAKHPAVILGSTVVAQCNAMAAIVKENGPVQYCFSPGIHPEHGAYTFSSGVSTRDQAVAMVRYFKKRGWSRIGLLTSTDATGEDAARNFNIAVAAPEAHGETIVAQERFNTSDVSVTAQLTHIKGASPQVIVGWTTGTPFGTVLRGIAETGIDLPIGAGNGNIIYSQMAQYKQFAPKELIFAGGQFFRDPKMLHGPLEGAITLFDKALAPTRPDLGHSLGFDPAMIVVDALRKLGPNASAKELREYLLGLHGYVGINGTYDFHSGDNRGLGVGNAVLVRYDAGRELFVPVSKPGGLPL